MSNTTQQADLLDLVMSIDGEPPLTLPVGGHEITVRRSHTGQQFAAYHQIEEDRDHAVRAVLETKKSEKDKVAKIEEIMADYLSKMLDSLCVDTDEKTISAVADLIHGLPNQARTATLRKLGVLAGVVTEDGRLAPFTRSSSKETSTDD